MNMLSDQNIPTKSKCRAGRIVIEIILFLGGVLFVMWMHKLKKI